MDDTQKLREALEILRYMWREDEAKARRKLARRRRHEMPSRGLKRRRNQFHLIVYELAPVKIRMDGSKTHMRPHIHIDYARDRHAATYAIDSGEKLAGRATREHKRISEWIIANRDLLERIWSTIRAGEQCDESHPIVVELRAASF